MLHANTLCKQDMVNTAQGEQPQRVTSVQHAVHIQLDKEGVKAGAATVVCTTRSVGGPQIITFDRPFLFAIVTANGTPVIMVSSLSLSFLKTLPHV